jgi:hypothetical protein
VQHGGAIGEGSTAGGGGGDGGDPESQDGTHSIDKVGRILLRSPWGSIWAKKELLVKIIRMRWNTLKIMIGDVGG